jgi:hypothetical protein
MDVEWLILADAAQVINGKLYLLGGGWTTLTVAGFPAQHRCALAAAFAVPWTETSRAHAVELEVVTEDGQTLATVNGRFEVGRPPGILPGQPQRLQFAAEMVLAFEAPGVFVVIARADGEERRRVQFNVAPAAPGPKPGS